MPLECILSDPQTRAGKPPSFRVRVFAGPELCRSSQPIYDGARALLDLGYEPEDLVTFWHEHPLTRINKPQCIVYLARWMVSDGAKGMRLEKWKPHPRQNAVS